MATVGSKISKLEKKKLALRMIEKGFKNTIIELATGESNSMIRSYRKDANPSCVYDDSISGQLKIAARIVDNRRRMLEAGIFVSYYLGLTRDRFKGIDYDALIRAHDLYIEYNKQINCGRIYNAITINEGFVLVRDMRSRKSKVSINTCKCQAIYITVADQRMRAGCPACSIARSSEAGNLEDDLDDLLDDSTT